MRNVVRRVSLPGEKLPMYFNPDTGEVLDFKDENVWVQTQEDRERSKRHFDKASRAALFNRFASSYGEFVWVVYSVAQKLLSQIKPSSLTRLMLLSTYIGYDGRLYKSKNATMGVDDVAYCLAVSRAEVGRFLCEMYEHDILLDRDDGIYVNRDFFTKGKVDKQDVAVLANRGRLLTRLYVDAVRDLYAKSTPRSHKSLSYIFQILPFVNREYNIVCHNPLEADAGKICPMTLGEFCDVIGYNSKNAYRLSDVLFEAQFEIDGVTRSAIRYVVSKDVDKSSYCMFINPRVYYAGSDLSKVEVLGQF